MAVTWKIRRLRASDQAVVLALARSLDRWFNEAGLVQMERDLRSHRGFVAVRRGRVVGFITWARLEPGVANLSWMGVAEAEHRHGIGRDLLDALVADLRPRGVQVLEVSTVADSLAYEPYAATRRFYRAVGFRTHAIDPKFYGDGDEWYDRLRLRLDLPR